MAMKIVCVFNILLFIIYLFFMGGGGGGLNEMNFPHIQALDPS